MLTHYKDESACQRRLTKQQDLDGHRPRGNGM